MRSRRQSRCTRSSKPIPPVPRKAEKMIDLEKIRFSRHALDQLITRMSPQVLKKPEKTAKKILAGSVEDCSMSRLNRFKRLLNNGGVEVVYLINSGWRFVVKPENDGSFLVLTIERAYKPL